VTIRSCSVIAPLAPIASALLCLAACSATPPAQPAGAVVAEADVSARRATSAAAPSCPPGSVRVEGGTFAESKRGVSVTIGALCVGAHEVTVDEFARCASQGRCAPAHDTARWPLADEASLTAASEACNARHQGRGDHPVNCVDWAQADAYCAFVGMRLPTDEEWEWLARGGPRGSAYPWGDEPPTAARVCAARDETCAATTSATSGEVAGLLGNVWEWTSSFADARRQQRSFRGGGFSTPLDGLARWPRSAFPETARTEVIGVRCVAASAVR
jgi:formylglycine-generating enzyme required for sulfatase activity